MTDFNIDSVVRYNAIATMTTALPNLQQITLGYLGHGHKYSDGEDPSHRAFRTANWTTYDIEIMSRFGKLRSLHIHFACLTGQYPFLFNFPLLQKLSITDCTNLKWDLEMLADLPSLKELYVTYNADLTGNINSLRVLKDTFEKVMIANCRRVDGNLMDLADFPHLKMLNLSYTSVTGDVRDIGEQDFSILESLALPYGVYGCTGFEFQRISDVFDFMNIIYRLIKKRASTLFEGVYWKLSKESPDWYVWSDEKRNPEPPLEVQFARAGSRLGWRWENESSYHGPGYCFPCEVNWLDPEPEKDSVDYEQYVRELLQCIQKQTVFYKGYHQPPTEEEYNRLCEGLNDDKAD
jgi:hypothetical protein